MKSQRQATVETILNVLADREVVYELNSPTCINDVLTPQDKVAIREELYTQFKSGQVQYKADFQSKVDDEKELRSYISGLVNNWVRKAPEFNNGDTYKAKNPGSRISDEQLREMRKLLTVTTDEGARDAINEAIIARLEELKPANTVQVDISKIPEALRIALGL